MNSPGVKSLATFDIGAAATQTADPIISLAGMRSLSIHSRFIYGAGGTNVKLYIQTSLDAGLTWMDVACVLFELANETKVINLSADGEKGLTTPTEAALADDTVVQGFLGDRVRMKIISTGTYTTNTQLVVKGVAR